MKSIIAEYAQTRAEYALLVAAIATLGKADDEQEVRAVCDGVLSEYRDLPEAK